MDRRALTKTQKLVLAAAFVPMLATGVAGGIGTFSNIQGAYGSGTALGAVAAGEGATAVLALVLLGLTMLGQAAPGRDPPGAVGAAGSSGGHGRHGRRGPGPHRHLRRHPHGHVRGCGGHGVPGPPDRGAHPRPGCRRRAPSTATMVQALAYHRARAANHPDDKVRKRSERTSWKLARKAEVGDVAHSAVDGRRAARARHPRRGCCSCGTCSRCPTPSTCARCRAPRRPP